ncbi:MAG: hypothetical protein JO108_30960 [Acidobacteriaceae bacterium]|nr:hypothetical protein [Acidobacteriaceae bacterium]
MRFRTAGFLALISALPALAATDGALLALVPSGTKVVSSVDVNKARSSPFGQFLLARMNAQDPGLQNLNDQTGFDPRRDLEYLVFAATGPKGTARDYVLLLRGTFDQARISSLAQSKGIDTVTVDGVPIYFNSKRGQQPAFTFPEVDVAALGTVAALQQVIQNRANPAILDSDLQQLVSQAGAQNDAWFASLIPATFFANEFVAGATSTAGPAQILQAVRGSSGGVLFGDSLRFTFDAVTRSAQDALALSDVLRFAAGTVATRPDARAQMVAPALAAATVSTSGSAVHASMNLTEQTMEQLVQMGLPARHNTH